MLANSPLIFEGRTQINPSAITAAKHCFGCFGICALLLLPMSGISSELRPASARDGHHDFDFELGSWKIHLKRLLKPLADSNSWVEFDGTSVTRKVWDGRAQIEEFETDGAAGHIEGLTLRLYNPETRQWSLYWASSKDGAMGGPPNIGEFKDGRGEFFTQDTFNGRAILIRYAWSGISSNRAHFEQAYSEDGGKSWEVNWITDQTRVSGSEGRSPQ